MRPIIDHRSTGPLGASWLILLLLATATALANGSSPKVDNEDEDALMRQLSSDMKQLSPDQLRDLMEQFGQEIGGLMSDNIQSMLQEEKARKSTTKRNAANDDDLGVGEELERMNRAKEMVAKDAESRIAAAGRAGTGELAEFSLSDAYANGKDFFVNKVNVRLQQAGSYLGSQMSSLANMTPSLKDKLRKAPERLRKILSWPTFFNFKVKFNKVYESRMSELYHQMVFLKTQTLAGIHNMKFFFGKTRHLQKTTQYADLTDRDYIEQTGNEASLADKLDEHKQERPNEQQLAKLRALNRDQRNIYGGDMGELLAKSRQTSPAERLAKKRASQGRRKRDISELDDDDEEGPMYSFEAFGPPSDSKQADGANGSEPDDNDEEEDEDLGGNQEAEMVDDFATGFQNVDLEAQMDAELEDDDDHSNELEPESNEDADEDEANFTPIDWSQHRCMPIIENQERCGYCYALVASTMSDFYICMWNLKDNPDARPRRLSGRFVSDCGRYMYQPDKELLIEGCKGGIIGQAIKFIREAGAMSFFGYENHRVAAKVKFEMDHCVLPKPPALKDWAPIKANYLENVTLVGVEREDWSTVNLFLHAAGPVIVNVRPWIGFKNYAGGIVDEIQVLPDTGKVHSMLIVGRDRDEQGRVYYKLRNTHGTPWGEKGYARIESKALQHYSTIKGILMPLDPE